MIRINIQSLLLKDIYNFEVIIQFSPPDQMLRICRTSCFPSGGEAPQNEYARFAVAFIYACALQIPVCLIKYIHLRNSKSNRFTVFCCSNFKRKIVHKYKRVLDETLSGSIIGSLWAALWYWRCCRTRILRIRCLLVLTDWSPRPR